MVSQIASASAVCADPRRVYVPTAFNAEFAENAQRPAEKHLQIQTSPRTQVSKN